MKRKFLSLILTAAFTTSLVIMPAISTSATEKKTNSISALSQYENNYISNDFVKLWLSEDGEFAITTTGGDPVNSNDNNKDLLFGYTNSEVLKFGSKSMEAFDSSWSDTSFEENHVKSTYNSTNGIKVLRELSLVKGLNSSYTDSISMKYTFVNNSSESKTFSFQTMLDTMLGSNDHAPFNVPGIGGFSTQKELNGNQVPNYWFAYDNLENPTIVSKYNFSNSSKPNKVQFTNWGSFTAGYDWDDNVDEDLSNGDSCVIMFWEDITLAPGESKTIDSSYGVSSLNTQISSDISVSVLNNDTIAANEDGTYPTYETTATVKNSGDISLNDITSTIEIPEEYRDLLSIVGDATHNIGTLAPDQSANSDIQLKVAEGNYYDDINAYFNVIVNSDSTETKTVRQNVTIKANAERNITASLAGGENVSINPNEDNEYNPYKVDVTINNISEEDPDFNNEPNVHVDLEIPEEFKDDLTLLPLPVMGEEGEAEEDSPNHFIPVSPGYGAGDGWNLAIKPSYEDRVITYNVKVTYGNEAPIVLTQTLNIKGLTPPPTPEIPEAPETPTTPEVKPSEPVKTGDPSNIAGLLIASMTSLGGVVALRKKYRPKH
ncbi:MAG: hypothetical protein KIC66_10970 [Clostridium sp.]|uniref:hypothetical protein n=1 Tax=Clostridium sp. TaxID=1506 RepID=UPI0025C6B125|nr:hypothetical protein [Clostridium sp.]MBS5927590.1 hypothetical protein [Clostridium sp.]